MFAFYISKILAKKFKGYFFRTLYIGFDTLTFRQKFSFDDLRKYFGTIFLLITGLNIMHKLYAIQVKNRRSKYGDVLHEES